MKPIVINNFSKGIASTPQEGFQELRNIDIVSDIGVAKIGLKAVDVSGGTVTATPLWFVNNPASTYYEIYALDSNQTVYKTIDAGNGWTKITGNGSGAGYGIAVWKNYLFVMRDVKIDVYGPLNGVASWTLDWQTIDTTGDAFHPALVGQDDILYIGCGRYLASIAETSGLTFAPGTASTYNFNSRALDLAANYKIRALTELGRYLMIGTYMGTYIYAGPQIADIFPWDRTSPSFEQPIRIKEKGIHALTTIQNRMYIFAGVHGRCFISDGSNVDELFRVPENLLTLTSGSYYEVYPGAITFHEGRLLFGFTKSDDSTSDFAHVWSYDLKTGALAIENTNSTVTNANFAAQKVGAIFSTGRKQYIFGWKGDSSDYGIDQISTALRCVDYTARIRLPYITAPDTALAEIEIEFTKPLLANQGVRLSYRTDLNASFTTIDTIDYATYGATMGEVVTLGITPDYGFQIQAELTTGSGLETPELKAIYIR